MKSKESLSLLSLAILACFSISFNALAQGNGISIAGGIGYSGKDFSNSRIGFFANAGFPIGSSEIRCEISHYNFPYGIASNDLKLSSFETAFHYGGFPTKKTQRAAFIYGGGGVNLNMFSGGSESRSTKSQSGRDSSYNGPIDNTIRVGFGLNLGVGIFLSTYYSIYAEYSAKGIFYGHAGIGWGGIRVGFRYQPVD